MSRTKLVETIRTSRITGDDDENIFEFQASFCEMLIMAAMQLSYARNGKYVHYAIRAEEMIICDRVLHV